MENNSNYNAEQEEKSLKREIVEWIKTIAMAVILSLIITTFVRPTLVKGVSMFPTLDQNHYLLLYRMAYAGDKMPKPGDIVVFKSHLLMENGKGKDLVKRVIAVEGDHILIRDGKVYVNGTELTEDYINGGYTDGEISENVPPGYIFAMGDNRPNSRDSRDPEVGMIPKGDIVGKVFIRLFPFNRIRTF
ncbi:MAG: signal peptidase I [Peptostreptococcaceae bacterium]|nr:signal peptidase I [Peptostreptococcaceae bacterium]